MKILAAVFILVVMSSGVAAQSAAGQQTSAGHARNAQEFAANRDGLFVDATRIAVRASLPADGNAQLSRQELMSILLLTSLQDVPRQRGH